MINRVILAGHVDGVPETTNGEFGAVTRMDLRTTHQWKVADGRRETATHRHHLVTYGRLAEICAALWVPDTLIYVEGYLRMRAYNDAGARHRISEVVLTTMRRLHRPSDGDADDGIPRATAKEAGVCGQS